MNNKAFINNRQYSFESGESILSFVRRHLGQNRVPTLCDNDRLEAYGSCRMCSVEVAYEGNGNPKVVAACHNSVNDGMRISTDSERITRLRKNILELVLTDHPLDCLICEANNNCRLQDVAARIGIRDVRYPDGDHHRHFEKDYSHPYMVSDLSKCINCYQCIRACDEIQGEMVLSMAGRGFESKIIKGMDQSFDDSECVSCGACVEVCPTAAISDIYKGNQAGATDVTRTVCTYCGVGCNLEVYTNAGNIVSIAAAKDAEVNAGHLCLKGRYAFRFYNHPERLTSPMIKRNGQFEEATWDEAYSYIAEKFKTIISEHGPHAIAGISSARCTNEENYLMQKFMRVVVGTNNIDGCARVCHAPTALGMQRAFGTGAATNSIEDLYHTNCILIIGANPTEAHPVTGARIKQVVMKGVPMIVVDPRKTMLARHAKYHLQLRPGTNVAVLNMFMFYLVKENLIDEPFIMLRCEGWDELRQNVLNLDIEALEKISGVDRELVRLAAIEYGSAESAMCFHGLGVTEHFQGTFAITQIANLAMMTGNIGRKGVGVNPLRGQNNVQGAADMGVQPHQGPGYLDVANPEFKAYYEDFYKVEMPDDKGYKIPEMFDASIRGDLKALWLMGEDVIQSEPNSNHVREALSKLDFMVVQELFMSETASHADVILPASSFFEKSGTFTNGERRIQRVKKTVEPLEGTKPDGQIICEMMNTMGYDQPPYHPATMLEEISQVVPFFKGVVWEELGDNGKQWPVMEDGTDTQILHQSDFKRGKGKFHYTPFEESPEIVNHGKAYPLILTTNRNLEHYNSGSMTRRTPSHRIVGEDFLFINEEDAVARKIEDGTYARLYSARGEVKIKVKISDLVKAGVVSSTFHFPEVMMNEITSSVMDSEASCPEYKVVSVEVAPIYKKHKSLKGTQSSIPVEGK